MSGEKAEVVRRIYELGARRETAHGALDLYGEDLVWDVSRLRGVDFGGGVFHGRAGFQEWFTAWYAAWENTVNELEELIEVGDRVVSVHTQRGRGRASGIEVDTRQYAVWTIEDGKVRSVVWFLTRDEALAAARAG